LTEIRERLSVKLKQIIDAHINRTNYGQQLETDETEVHHGLFESIRPLRTLVTAEASDNEPETSGVLSSLLRYDDVIQERVSNYFIESLDLYKDNLKEWLSVKHDRRTRRQY
jgi:hypothetical protein